MWTKVQDKFSKNINPIDSNTKNFSFCRHVQNWYQIWPILFFENDLVMHYKISHGKSQK